MLEVSFHQIKKVNGINVMVDISIPFKIPLIFISTVAIKNPTIIQ